MKFPISKFTIHGSSMNPTLVQGQDILSFNWFIRPKIGDIVIIQNSEFRIQSVKRIKEIIGDKVWVEGDNKEESTDSRDFGAVSSDQIIGKVIYRSGNIPCPQCNSPVIGIYGRKDAICSNCGFKLACCRE